MDVDWLRQHKSDITGYSVRYTEQGGLSWKNVSNKSIMQIIQPLTKASFWPHFGLLKNILFTTISCLSVISC